jgi:hypothetical protein
MSYVSKEFKSRAEFKAAVESGEIFRTYNPSGMFPTPQNGDDLIESPHYPKPHSHYWGVIVKDGIVVKVK